MSYHDRLIGKATDLALTVDYRWRHGAILAKGSKIFAQATNKVRNSPLIEPDNATFHAEEMVIREYCRILGVSYLHPTDLSDFTLYISRVDRIEGKPMISRPCDRCMKNMEYFGIQDFVYTNELGGYSHESIKW